MLTCEESERALLGALLSVHSDVRSGICADLTTADFSNTHNQRIFGAIQSIVDENLEVNKVSVRERSRVASSVLDQCELEGAGIVPSQTKTLVADIRNASARRKLLAALKEASGECVAGTHPDTVLEALESRLYGTGAIVGAKTKDAYISLQKAAQKASTPSETRVEVSTGLTLLDKAIIGLRPKLYVIGARPSMGKSALAQTIAHNVVGQANYGVLHASAEMDDEEIAQRSIAHYANVNVRSLMSGQGLTDDDRSRIMTASKAIPDGRYRIIDKPVNIGTLRRMARIEASKMARNGIRLALILVDYIQLYAEGEHREQAVSAVSRGLKLLSQELSCAVIGLSQLNRGLEYREDKRPTLADLRESGAIEQDADCVMFVYRPSRYDETVPEEVTELIVAKQRGGPVGTFQIRFNPKVTTFTDVQ